MTAGAGLLGSISLSFVKGLTEAYRVDGFTGGYALYIYIAIALAIGILQLNILNKSMELYDQVDTIPIYQSSLILLNIASGAIIMQESELYTTGEFLLLVFCGLISVSGVWLIIRKPPPKASTVSTSAEVVELLDLGACSHLGHANCSCKESLFDINMQLKRFHLKSLTDQRDISQSAGILNYLLSRKYHRGENELAAAGNKMV